MIKQLRDKVIKAKSPYPAQIGIFLDSERCSAHTGEDGDSHHSGSQRKAEKRAAAGSMVSGQRNQGAKRTINSFRGIFEYIMLDNV